MGVVGHQKDFGFYCKGDGKFSEGLEQRSERFGFYSKMTSHMLRVDQKCRRRIWENILRGYCNDLGENCLGSV